MINDHIHLTEDGKDCFIDIQQQFAIKHDNGMQSVSNDLIVSSTVPLRQVVVHAPGDEVPFEVVIYDTPIPCGTSNGFDVECVGRLTKMWSGGSIGISLLTRKGDNAINISYADFYFDGRKLDKDRVERIAKKLELSEDVLYSLVVWYGIQVALLNPYVKNVFRTETIRKTGFNPNGKKRKSIVKYIRHHYLNPGALSPKMETGQLLRKTMAWYVCGHWRHYQGGKTIFIQPYWKGPLRETKVCEPRERVIV